MYTYKLINIGKRDVQKETLQNFFQYLDALEHELKIENNVKKNENREMTKMGKGKSFPRQKFIRYLFKSDAVSTAANNCTHPTIVICHCRYSDTSDTSPTHFDAFFRVLANNPS